VAAGRLQCAGRITLPRPPADQAAFFQASAQRIVGAIAAERGTVTWSSQTGPVCDVLYSAAGNSADQLYYDNGIYAWDFEVGNPIWNQATQQWQSVGFQPPFPEAHAEAMEYAGASPPAGGSSLPPRPRDQSWDRHRIRRRLKVHCGGSRSPNS
jgi:hypothetical protein